MRFSDGRFSSLLSYGRFPHLVRVGFANRSFASAFNIDWIRKSISATFNLRIGSQCDLHTFLLSPYLPVTRPRMIPSLFMGVFLSCAPPCFTTCFAVNPNTSPPPIGIRIGFNSPIGCYASGSVHSSRSQRMDLQQRS